MRRQGRIYTILALLAVCTALAGCGKKSNTEQDSVDLLSKDTYAMQVGDEKITYPEAMVYVLFLKQEYEPTLGPSIWEFKKNGTEAFEDMAKEEVMNEITELKIIGDKGKDMGITLDEDEKATAKETAQEHFAVLSEKDRTDYGITVEVLTKVYEDNLLATKVFDVTTAEVDTEVTDEEARQITLLQVVIDRVKENLDGTYTALTAAEEKAALKKAKKLLAQARKTTDFEAFANANSDCEVITSTFGKGDRSQAIETAGFALKKGEISDLVTTDEGYYILYCVSELDEDATADKKEDLILKRQVAKFQDVYATWLGDYKILVNTKVWDAIRFQNQDGKEEPAKNK